MRKNFGKQPWLFPMPVLIVSAYDEEVVPQAMAAGWGGICDPQHLCLCILNFHRTTHAIEATKAFTAAVGDLAHIKSCDYVGTVSGNDVKDKVEKSGFHTVKSEFVNAPLIEELPVSLECELESYDPKTGTLIGKIVNVSADEGVLDENGQIDADRFEALSYDPCYNGYRVLGARAGEAQKVCNPNR